MMEIPKSEVLIKMLIRKMELENVKTHKDTSINFNKGLNILYGKNGAGKSTILEMIGFVLFDFLKSKTYHADYVRDVENEKPSYGKIKIWINGLDNEIYQITRYIGKTEIVVKDDKGQQISPPVNTVSRFKVWIKKQLGIKYEIDLETLFNAAIGIPQGMIVNSFLKSPKDRKEYFDKIFQLDSYETYWENLSSVESAYRDDLINIQNKISGLKGETKDKKQQVQKKEDLTKELSTVSNNLKKYKDKNEDLNEKLEELEDIKVNLEKATTNLNELEVKRKKEEENLSFLQEQLKESIQAEKICSETKDAYEQYKKNSNTKKELISKNQKLSALKDNLNKINQKYQKVKNKKENIEEKIKEAERSKKLVEELKLKYQKFEELEDKIKKIDEEIAIINSTKKTIRTKQKNFTALQKQVRTLNKDIRELPGLQQKYKEIQDFENKMDSLILNIKSIKNDLSFFRNNQKKIKKQLCPFTDQGCKNMQLGEFDIEFFKEQIELKSQELSKQKNKLEELTTKVEEKDQLKKDIEALKKKKVQREQLEKQIKEQEEEISDLKEESSQEEDLVDAKRIMVKQKEELKKDHNNYLVFKEKSQNLEELKESLIPFNKAAHKIEEKQNKIKSELEKFKDVPVKLERIRNKEDELEISYKRYQQNINEANKLSRRQGQVNKIKKKVDSLRGEYKQLLEKRNDLEARYDKEHHDKLQETFKENNKKIIQWKEKSSNLKDRITEINEDIEKLEEKEKELKGLKEIELKLTAEKKFIKKIRHWLRGFKPKMRKELIGKVNMEASQIYRNIRGDQNTSLYWNENYEIKIRKAKIEKNFIRLSGGEKMAAALAVRLAILKTLTSAKFAIFDEPTTNLDPESRNNLSKYINNIKGFHQLFVISHDEAFNRHSDYVIKLTKDDNEQTHIHYLTNV